MRCGGGASVGRCRCGENTGAALKVKWGGQSEHLRFKKRLPTHIPPSCPSSPISVLHPPPTSILPPSSPPPPPLSYPPSYLHPSEVAAVLVLPLVLQGTSDDIVAANPVVVREGEQLLPGAHKPDLKG